MPALNENQLQLKSDLPTYGGNTVLNMSARREKASYSETAVAAFSEYTLLGLGVKKLMFAHTPEGLSNEPFSIEELENTKYWEYRKSFNNAETRGQALRIKANIDDQLALEQAAADHPIFAMATIVGLALLPYTRATSGLAIPAMVTDFLISKQVKKHAIAAFAKAGVKEGSALAKIGGAAFHGSTFATIDTAMLQVGGNILGIEGYTKDKALKHIESAAVIGAIMGASIKGLGISVSKVSKEKLENMVGKVEKEIGVRLKEAEENSAQTVAEKAERIAPEGEPPATLESVKAEPGRKPSTALSRAKAIPGEKPSATLEDVQIKGAPSEVHTFEMNESDLNEAQKMTGTKGLTPFAAAAFKFARAAKILNTPGIEVSLSESEAAQRAMLKLWNNPWFRAEDAAAFFSSETVGSYLHGKYSRILWDSTEEAFLGVRERARKVGGEAMRRREFDEHLREAMISGDTHLDPIIKEAAQKVRRDVIDPLTALMQHYKLLPEELNLQTAKSYFPIEYDRPSISSRRADWNALLYSHLRRIRAEDALKLSNAQKKLARLKLEEREIGRFKKSSTKAQKARVPKPGAVLKLEEKIKVLQENIDSLSEDNLPAHAQDITDRLTHGNALDGKRDSRIITINQRGSSKPRTFMIAHKDLLPFTKVSPFEVLDKWIKNNAIDVGIASRFNGKLRFSETEEYREIKSFYAKKASEAATEKEAAKLEKSGRRVLRVLDAQMQRARGVYNLPSGTHADRMIRSATVMARAWNVVRFLGLAGLSATHDVFMILTDVYIGRFLKDTLYNRITTPEIYGASKKDLKFLGFVYETMRKNQLPRDMAAIVDPYNTTSTIENILKIGQEWAGRLSLVTQVDNLRRTSHAMTVQQQILRGVESVAEGKATKEVLKYLRRSGIDENLAKEIHAEWKLHGKLHESDFMIANTHKWNPVNADKMGLAISVNMKRLELNPSEMDLPLFYSTSLGRVMRQFTGWTYSASSKIALAGLQNGDAKTLQAIIFMWMAAVLEERAKEALRGTPEDKRMTGYQVSIKALSSTGLFGILGLEMERLGALSGGSLGYYTGAFEDKDHAAADPYRFALESMLGATGGLAADLTTAGQLLLSDAKRKNIKEKDIRAVRRVFPWQNYIWFSWLYNKAEAGIADKAIDNDREARRPFGVRR